jgi:hypothetical protein
VLVDSYLKAWRLLAAGLGLLVAVGCARYANVLYDFDEDGSLDADDCAPSDPLIHPGAGDPYGDGIDQNCDGADGVDSDGDGYPANDDLADPSLYDCDDSLASVHPGATDSVGDGVDSNCDGHDGTDGDGDTFASLSSGGSDCSDDDAAIHPGAVDPYGDGVDQNCDGTDGVDTDGDGYPAPGEDVPDDLADCNDSDDTIHPGAEENPNSSQDEDCDGFGRPIEISIFPPEPRTGESLVLQVTTDAVAYDIAWSVDGELRPELEGLLTISPSHTVKGQLWSVQVTPYDPAGHAADSVTASTLILNTPPVLTMFSGLVPSPAEGDILSSVVTVTDEDPADIGTLELHSTWFVNGLTLALAYTVATLDSNHFDKGDEIWAVLTPADGIEYGLPIETNHVLAVNTLPTASAATITPGAGDESTVFSCQVSGWSDPDPADVEDYDYNWTVDSTSVSSSATIDGTLFNSNQSLLCEATPNDGEGVGATLTSTLVNISNSVPSITSVLLEPSDPTEASTLTASAQGIIDADPADTVSFSHRWFVNNQLVGDASTLSGDHFNKTDTIFVEVTPSDGTDTGVAVNSNTVTAVNTAPQVTALTLSPDPAYTGSTLTPIVTSSDPDPTDSVTYSYQWWVNTSTDAGQTTVLEGSSFVKNDEVLVEVTPSDGEASGTAVMSAALVIANTAPTAPSVHVSPAQPDLTDDLVCSISAQAQDPDVDDLVDPTLSYEFSWDHDGSATTAWNQSGLGATGQATVDAATRPGGGTWTCEVTANDGTEAGPPGVRSVSFHRDCDHYGDGHLGSYTVAAGTSEELNSYSRVTGDNPAGANSIGVDDPTLFSVGDLVLLLTMRDPEVDDALRLVGQREYHRVTAVGTGELQLEAALEYTYNDSNWSSCAGSWPSGCSFLVPDGQLHQVIRVPEYQDLTVAGTVTAPGWESRHLYTNSTTTGTGGVVAIKVYGTLTVAGGGSIDVISKGYNGGQTTHGWFGFPNNYSPPFVTHGEGPRGAVPDGPGGGQTSNCGANNAGQSGGHCTSGIGNGLGGDAYCDTTFERLTMGGGGGSNGGGGDCHGAYAANGGGLIVLHAGTVDIQGELSAGGGVASANGEGSVGGGAGGMIYVVAGGVSSLSGDLRADGSGISIHNSGTQGVLLGGDGIATVLQCIDSDSDGYLLDDDCDDSDPAMPGNDADCDGTNTAADCDDSDPASTLIAQDGDCDGTLTGADCDDNDPNSTIVLEDVNCDGVIDCALGSDQACPGSSCLALLPANVGSDGNYWLEPDGDGAGAFQAYCDMSTDGGGWTRFAVIGGTSIIYADFYASGAGTLGDANYSIACNALAPAITSGTAVVRLQMGTVTDFFRPVAGSSVCQMLGVRTLHQWSASATGPWTTPNYYVHGLGGSLASWPSDGRGHLSFWGETVHSSTNPGGCCHDSYTSSSGWSRPFEMFFRE